MIFHLHKSLFLFFFFFFFMLQQNFDLKYVSLNETYIHLHLLLLLLLLLHQLITIFDRKTSFFFSRRKTMSESRGCCRCCCSFIFTLGLTSLFMWLSLRTSNPKCSIEKFDLPALNTSMNNSTRSTNNTLYFILKLENPNKDKGIYYDAVNVTVAVYNDKPSKNYSLIGSSVIPNFYQGHKKTAKKNGSFEFNRQQAVFRAVLNNSTAAEFRVDMTTAVRFKIMAWRTKRNKIRVRADVKVTDQGSKDGKKNIKLTSMAAPYKKMKSCFVVLVVGFLINFFVFYFT
ncbi:hypothetical protein Dsin_022901 [Dipteronia sinensis]|uniref:Late embryogenesis abundant protein LEA-2 subgroup domain-containing protein n=1 Tax=Dipteronia sinensis TaxID=43782 RepID=A0AAE0A3R8_9ROSI|nr:hypothetical protein Dsin_022901 [Dipteronia sinensis]